MQLDFDTSKNWRVRDTAKAAAANMQSIGKAQTIRETVYACLKQHGAMTADKCAEITGLDFLNVRRRMSELAKINMIEDTGERLPSSYGKPSIVWGVIK